jgi:hypothetical protein
MKKELPPQLNHWRLREGALGSDEDSGYEGCFIIPSAQKDPKGIGHPFHYHQIFQVQASEIAGGILSGVDWEKLTVISKTEIHDRLEQRQPTIREMRWIKQNFWEDHETIAMLMGSTQSHLAIDHRIMHWFRPGSGWNILPELFRELVPNEDTFAEPEDSGVSVVDLVKARRAGAASREREEAISKHSRAKADALRILDTAKFESYDSGARYSISQEQFDHLRKIIEIG